jgi:cell division protein FtsZ
VLFIFNINTNPLEKNKMENNKARIKVIGVGGAGCNAVDHMIQESIRGVEFFGLNTDVQALDKTEIPNRIQIGKKLTNGLGAGADPSIGMMSAEEDIEAIKHILEDTDMVFITAGMGGGTGTGAAPVIAKVAKDMDILTIAIVTKPFSFENRDTHAVQGIEELNKNIDSLLIIPNEKLLPALGDNITFLEAFFESNKVLLKSVKGIAELITNAGFINVDFADVKKVMKNSGISMMGLGLASGDNRVIEATQQAINSELLESSSIKGAKGVLVNVSGNIDLPLNEFREVGNIVKSYAHKDAEIITGMTINHELNDQIMVTVVATELDAHADVEDECVEEIDSNLPLAFLQQKGSKIKNNLINSSNDNSKPCEKTSVNKVDIIDDIPNDESSSKVDIIDNENKKENDSSWDVPLFLQRNDD